VADKKHIKKHKLKKFDVEVALLQQLHKDVKGSTGGTPFMLVDLDDEIRRMNNDEYINKHKVRIVCVWDVFGSQLSFDCFVRTFCRRGLCSLTRGCIFNHLLLTS